MKPPPQMNLRTAGTASNVVADSLEQPLLARIPFNVHPSFTR
jgi:hypothetical protein